MCGVVFVLQVDLVQCRGDGEGNGDSAIDDKDGGGGAVAEQFGGLGYDIVKLNEANARRGPDITGYRVEKLVHDFRSIQLHFWGHVLHLRGNTPTPQPLSNNQDVLLWNGEVFDGLQVERFENDGALVLKLLSSATTAQEIASIVDGLDGPQSFVFYKFETSVFW